LPLGPMRRARRSDFADRVGAAGRASGEIVARAGQCWSNVLREVSILSCDWCDRATAQTERGWRAYASKGDGGETSIAIMCPSCSERLFGEDEAAWSD
jgi:hypothetical protein